MEKENQWRNSEADMTNEQIEAAAELFEEIIDTSESEFRQRIMFRARAAKIIAAMRSASAAPKTDDTK